MSTAFSQTEPDAKLGTRGVVEVWDLATLRNNPLNPRGDVDDDPAMLELADSIREKGLLEPLLITPAGVIIAGHRRRRACELAGVTRLRVIVQDLSEKDQLDVMLIENLQREPLNPLQEALAYQGLLNRGASVSDIIRRTGLGRERIAGHLKLLKLPAQVQEWIARGRLAFSTINLLLAIDNELECVQWAERAIAAGWSKTQLEKAIGRNGSRPARLPNHYEQGGPVITRLIALESLRRCRAWPLTLEILERALNQVSCSCSVHADAREHPDLCRTCPLAHFLGAITREAHDAL